METRERTERLLTGDQEIILQFIKDKASKMSYGRWISWMRSTYPYSLAVKFAHHMGYPKPCHGFYLSLRQTTLE